MPPNRSRNSNAAGRQGKARVCLASLRGVMRLASWGSIYEFEDVICGIDDVDMLCLQPGWAYASREWLVRRLVWRPILRQLGAQLNPGLQAVALDKEYELFAFTCMHPSDLIYLNAIHGWKKQCKTKICFMLEFYAGWLREFEFLLKLLTDFDHVLLCFSGSVPAVRGLIGKSCNHMPLGVDALRFTPFPNPPARCIDVYSMGKRSEVAHEILLKMAKRKEIFYVYDTIPALLIQPRDYRQHRDLVANLAKRSRFFAANPAKVDDQETRGQSEVGARFFEGAAAGAALLGRAPTVSAFASDFDWPDAVVDIGSDEEDLLAALAKFEAEPERLQALGRKNAIEALRRFDWAYRWKNVLRIAGLEPTPRLAEREERLNRLATLAATDDLTISASRRSE